MKIIAHPMLPGKSKYSSTNSIKAEMWNCIRYATFDKLEREIGSINCENCDSERKNFNSKTVHPIEFQSHKLNS